MKPLQSLRYLIVCSCVLYGSNGFAQINLETDTVSMAIATASQAKYKDDMRRANKKSTSFVNFNTDKLKAIVDQCKDKGIDNIQFMIVTLRPEDVARYARLYTNLSTADRNDLAGRQILLIKVPREPFMGEPQASINVKNQKLSTAMLSLGLLPADALVDPAWLSSSLYFSVGTICPPPTSCD